MFKANSQGDWLKNINERLYEELENTSNGSKAKELIETIVSTNVQISADGKEVLGYKEGNGAVQEFQRLANAKSPFLDRYRKRLVRWGVDPKLFPLVPSSEWAWEFSWKTQPYYESSGILFDESDYKTDY